MDPDANLREQRELTRETMAILDGADEATGEFTPGQTERLADIALRLAELVEALDGWIARGGTLPRAWWEARSWRQT